jgi:hypothetical protein
VLEGPGRSLVGVLLARSVCMSRRGKRRDCVAVSSGLVTLTGTVSSGAETGATARRIGTQLA